ncbi:MAG TPA: acetyl-CoA carboxylase biotin carboxyl carrier protein [Blastocatellia bacterium]|nr:acetyl-CoA carboxylase biotin carboxyl carrier protein [Blastocatellia bacterium]
MKKTERKTKTAQVKISGKPPAIPETYSSKDVEKDVANDMGEFPSLTEIKELIEFVSEKHFNEFELELGEFRLRWRKGRGETEAPTSRRDLDFPLSAVDGVPVESVPAPPAAAQPAPAPPEEKLHIITSPIVGTFYRAPSPTAEVFVKLGDAVETGKTLCIIEAMKLMNEIPSDSSGTIAKIFVENGQPVEYGQPLFGIRV